MSIILKNKDEGDVRTPEHGQLTFFVSSSDNIVSAKKSNGAVVDLQQNKGRTLHDTTHSPIGLWQLNSSSLDSSGNGITLKEVGTIKTGTGFVGLALAHEGATGTGYWKSFNQSLYITGAMSGYALVNMTSSYSGDQSIFMWHETGESEGANVQYALRFSGGQIRYLHEHGSGVNDSYISTGLYFPVGEWFWVGFTRDAAATGIKFFINGQLIDSTTLSNAPTGGGVEGAAFVIGQDLGETDGLNGKVQTVKILDFELTEAQMLAEYERVFGVS